MTNPAKCHCGSISWERRIEESRYICASCKRPLWQPIETAPKDGTPVLAVLHCRSSGWTEVEVIEWDEEDEQWYGGKSGWIEDETLTGHWMPLPEPPPHD